MKCYYNCVLFSVAVRGNLLGPWNARDIGILNDADYIVVHVASRQHHQRYNSQMALMALTDNQRAHCRRYLHCVSRKASYVTSQRVYMYTVSRKKTWQYI